MAGRVGERNAVIFARYHSLFGLEGATLAAIGKEYGVTKERVRQIVARTAYHLGATP
jgi:DNA-directed RNA polymerase sigma subunit (sigma70/sigma32)